MANIGNLELLPDQTNDVDGVSNVLTKEGTSLPLDYVVNQVPGGTDSTLLDGTADTCVDDLVAGGVSPIIQYGQRGLRCQYHYSPRFPGCFLSSEVYFNSKQKEG